MHSTWVTDLFNKFKQCLELNRAFIKEPEQEKKKNTAEFIKYAYGFEPHIRAVTLYDFKFRYQNHAQLFNILTEIQAKL